MTESVAVVGAAGYVGRGIVRALLERGDVELTAVTRASYDDARRGRYHVVVNAAMPSSRFRARRDPAWDFAETVEKTAALTYGWSHDKLVQVSSVSARCQLDTPYGRHKAAAERLCRPDRDLVVRLGPMYSDDLDKGVLVDLLAGRTVWVDGSSRYGFAPRDWVAEWIVANLERTGTADVGGRDAVALSDVAGAIGADVKFEGAVDHQEFIEAPPDWPAARGVLDFLARRAQVPA